MLMLGEAKRSHFPVGVPPLLSLDFQCPMSIPDPKMSTSDLTMSTPDLKKLRESGDPRANPEAPYAEDREHRAGKWPDRAEFPRRYIVIWRETRGVALWQVQCRGKVEGLTTARKWAQEMSVQDDTTGEIAWVVFQDRRGDRETVDVWRQGYRLPNDQSNDQYSDDRWKDNTWTDDRWPKEGAPLLQPDVEKSSGKR
jgi:hypothetical protein